MKSSRAIFPVVATAAAWVMCATLTAVGQQSKEPAAGQPASVDQLPSAELQSVRAAVAKPQPVKLQAVVMQFTGTFDDLPARFEAFTKEFESQGLSKRKLDAAPNGIFVVYENPEGKSTYRLGVGVQVPTRLEPKDPLKVESFEHRAAARVTHVGSFKRLKNVRDAVDRESRANKSGGGRATTFPVIARLLNDPRKLPDNQRRTELIVPF